METLREPKAATDFTDGYYFKTGTRYAGLAGATTNPVDMIR